MTRRLTAGRLDFGDHLIETLLVTAAAQRRVIAFGGEALADMAANPRASADYHANIGHGRCLSLIT